MEVITWTIFGAYAVVRLWPGHAGAETSSDIDFQSPDKLNGSRALGIAWCFAALGVALDWRCAFQWLGGVSPFYSEIVLGKAILIVLACATAALLAVWVTRSESRDALLLFSLFSIAVYGVMSRHWTTRW